MEGIDVLRKKIGVNGQQPSSVLIAQRREARLAWEREHAAGLEAIRVAAAGHDVPGAGAAPPDGEQHAGAGAAPPA